MNIGKKIDALEFLYALQEEFMSEGEFACGKGCAQCCTARVTMTTLEGYHLSQHIEPKDRDLFFDHIRSRCSDSRFVPATTINRLAGICLKGGEPPAEPLADPPGVCPALAEDACPVYPFRPLGCRTMLSRIDCSKTGYAEIDDFSVAVSTVLMQYAEHLDAEGCTGNFTDVMEVFSSAANRAFYAEQSLPCRENRLVKNRPIPALMIPPEHRRRIRPMLEKIARFTAETQRSRRNHF